MINNGGIYHVYKLVAELLALNPVRIVLQTISYMAERVVGQGSFGIVFQVMFQYKL